MCGTRLHTEGPLLGDHHETKGLFTFRRSGGPAFFDAFHQCSAFKATTLFVIYARNTEMRESGELGIILVPNITNL